MYHLALSWCGMKIQIFSIYFHLPTTFILYYITVTMSCSVYVSQHICLGLEAPRVSCFRTPEHTSTQKVILNSDEGEATMKEEERKNGWGRGRGRKREEKERRRGQFLVS